MLFVALFSDICRYLRSVQEGDRDFLVPAHRDELGLTARKAADCHADKVIIVKQEIEVLNDMFDPDCALSNNLMKISSITAVPAF